MSDSYTWDPFNDTNNQINIDIELLKTEVGKHFPIYDIKYNATMLHFIVESIMNPLMKNLNLLGCHYQPKVTFQ